MPANAPAARKPRAAAGSRSSFPGELARLGARDRRRIHHDHSEGEQEQRRPEHAAVVLGERRAAGANASQHPASFAPRGETPRRDACSCGTCRSSRTRREQHRVARPRRIARERHRLLHRGRAQHRHARAGDRRFDQGGVAADEDERARRRARPPPCSGEKSCPFPSPPAMRTTFAPPCASPASAATVEPTLVPLESSYQRTPCASPTGSTRCGRPLNARSARSSGAERQAESRGRARARRARWRRCAVRRSSSRARRAGRLLPCASQGSPPRSSSPQSSPRRGASRPKVIGPSAGQRHGEAARVVAVEHLHAAAREDPRLGRGVLADGRGSGRDGLR